MDTSAVKALGSPYRRLARQVAGASTLNLLNYFDSSVTPTITDSPNTAIIQVVPVVDDDTEDLYALGRDNADDELIDLNISTDGGASWDGEVNVVDLAGSGPFVGQFNQANYLSYVSTNPHIAVKGNGKKTLEFLWVAQNASPEIFFEEYVIDEGTAPPSDGDASGAGDATGVGQATGTGDGSADGTGDAAGVGWDGNIPWCKSNASVR